jgi:hypothetical protein
VREGSWEAEEDRHGMANNRNVKCRGKNKGKGRIETKEKIRAREQEEERAGMSREEGAEGRQRVEEKKRRAADDFF